MKTPRPVPLSASSTHPLTSHTYIHIHPHPTSALYTTAILSHLDRRFGSVREFRRADTNPPSPPPAQPPPSPPPAASNLYRTRFAHSRSQLAALAASPLTIHVGGDTSDPDPDSNSATAAAAAAAAAGATPPARVLDPYNVFDTTGRHVAPPRSFTCTVTRVPPASARLRTGGAGEPRWRLVEHGGSERLCESLRASGAPANLVRGLAMRPEVVVVEAEHEAEEGVEGGGEGKGLEEEEEAGEASVRRPLTLMELYREAARRQQQEKEEEEKGKGAAAATGQ